MMLLRNLHTSGENIDGFKDGRSKYNNFKARYRVDGDAAKKCTKMYQSKT